MSDTPRTDDWYERERVDPTVSDGDRAYMEALQCGKGYANKLERELSAEKAAHHQTTLNWMAECESAAALTVRVGQLERELAAAVARAEAAETRADDLSMQVADLKRERDEAIAALRQAIGDMEHMHPAPYISEDWRKAAGLDA